MQLLDRTRFDLSLPLVVAELQEPRLITRIGQQSNANDLLDIHRVSRIVICEGNKRGVLLAPHFTDPATAPSQLGSDMRRILSEAGAVYKPWNLTLDYKYWTAEDVLRSVLPTELGEPPSGFAVVGHIAHMNLRDQFLPYKYLIGEVILDKNKPAVRTVVNKLDTIDTVYRTFDMEVIAGEPDFTVEQLESGCRFQFDFRKVYWNSRLHTEHDRLVQLFGSGHAICDPFAGVGPFAMPAAKRGNIVFANDLNPSSYESMVTNAKLNKLSTDIIHPFNEDAREFIRRSIPRLHEFRDTKEGHKLVLPPPRASRHKKQKVEKADKLDNADKAESAPEPPTLDIPEVYSHYVMNLPATAIEFLDAFQGLYKDKKFSVDEPALPWIHVHCFYKFSLNGPEPEHAEVLASLVERASKALGYKLSQDKVQLHDVRRVAPAKDMYCLSFQLPRAVAYM